MPAAPAAPPPAAPAAPAPSSPAPPSAPLSPVSAPTGNQWDESFADLEKLSNSDEPPVSPSQKPKAAKAKQAKPVPTPPKTPEPKEEEKVAEDDGMDEQPKVDEEDKAPEQDKPAETKETEGKSAKNNPWRLVDKLKAENTQYKKELEQHRAIQEKGELPEAAVKKFETLEKRNKELEEEIRYSRYEKSQDFIDSYQKPYEEAWGRAVSDIKEMVITNEDGTTRPGNARDILRLANMGVQEAWKLAKEQFGDAADEVMASRRQIRELSDKQQRALEDARKNAGERETQMNMERQAKAKAYSEAMAKTWAEVNKEAIDKYDFLRPADGQTERNTKLEKATKFVDEVLGQNLQQAKTEEERNQILKKHAALRNRAIGFSVLKHENTTLRAEVEALKKSLADFEGSEPTEGEPRNDGNGVVNADPMENSLRGLAALAD